MKVKLDVGGEVNVIPMRVFKQIEAGHVKMKRIKTNPFGYGGTNIPVEGKIKVVCEF